MAGTPSDKTLDNDKQSSLFNGTGCKVRERVDSIALNQKAPEELKESSGRYAEKL